VGILQNNCTNDIVMVTGDLITNTVNKFTELTMQQRKGTSAIQRENTFNIIAALLPLYTTAA